MRNKLRISKFFFLLSLALFFLLFVVVTPAFAHLESEEQIWDDPAWMVIQTPRYHFLTRQEIIDHMDIFDDFGFDNDFALYSNDTTIVVQQGDTREWASRKWITGGTNRFVRGFYFNKLSEIFVPGVVLHVYEWQGSFISRVCGNMTELGINPKGSIAGLKFKDVQENHVLDSEDVGIPNWKITLSNGLECPTNEQGKYCFDELSPGTYVVTEEERDGWVHTTPSQIIVTVGPGQTSYVNFGNFELGKISGYKWDDSDADAIREETDRELPNSWTVVLYKDGAKVGETTTGPDGFYEFNGLHYGNYSVWEVGKDNWRQTYPFSDSCVSPESTLEEGHHHTSIISGTDISNLDFGNIELGSITKTVYHYWWKEPIKDIRVVIEEIEVPGVLKNIPPLPREGYTNEAREVVFGDLLPGKYKITVFLPEDWHAEPDVNEHIVELKEGQHVTIENYIYDNDRREPRTLGFWRNWRHNYNSEEMASLIERVKTGSNNFSDLSMENIDDMLNPSGKKTADRMARIQYLVLWLNLSSERLGFNAVVDLSIINGWNTLIKDDDGIMTIHALMLQMRDLYNNNDEDDLTRGQWEILKNICDAINNYWVFVESPTGPID